ncbi:unnamed protein product [Cyprideis torosa]|uniref:Uncharacterized protein n=1 Tax=Cyprideis torosa TaxID=163714 RepID=A0A7R8ZJ26_9CRUS|nr:unnamed protein product [Cyprideis torosa]CAG0881343.1 unnamed protein product [Cyprideis torosa]
MKPTVERLLVLPPKAKAFVCSFEPLYIAGPRQGEIADEERQRCSSSLVVQSESLREYFGQFGDITEVMVMKDPTTRRSRCIAELSDQLSLVPCTDEFVPIVTRWPSATDFCLHSCTQAVTERSLGFQICRHGFGSWVA